MLRMKPSEFVKPMIPMMARVLVAVFSVACLAIPVPATAEWYAAGAVGPNFADRLTNISGTGILSGFQSPDWDLKNSLSFGAKVGYFPQHSWLGIEFEVLHSTPHVKNLQEIPGVHFRVITAGMNLIARYPGRTFQPYAGAGLGALIAKLGSSTEAQIKGDSDVTTAWNVLAGMRAFVTPYVAVFTEYKYTGATLRFDEAFSGGGGFEGEYKVQQVLFGVSYHF